MFGENRSLKRISTSQFLRMVLFLSSCLRTKRNKRRLNNKMRVKKIPLHGMTKRCYCRSMHYNASHLAPITRREGVRLDDPMSAIWLHYAAISDVWLQEPRQIIISTYYFLSACCPLDVPAKLSFIESHLALRPSTACGVQKTALFWSLQS